MADLFSGLGNPDSFSLTEPLPVMEEEPRQSVPPPIAQAAQDELVQSLKREIDEFRSSISPHHDRIRKWYRLYEARPKKRKKEFPWPGAANYTVPLIMSIVDSIHARIVKSVFEVDPIWLARARSTAAGHTNIATKAQWYLDYWADQMDLKSTMDEVLLNGLIAGVGILKLDWVRRAARIPSLGGMETAVTEFEGPRGQHVPLTDFLLIPADAPTIEDAIYVGHRKFLSRRQLLDRDESAIYFNVPKLLEASPLGDSLRDRTPNPEGIINPPQPTGEETDTVSYEVIELYGLYDFGGGKVPTIMTLSYEHEILLRLDPYPYEYGRPSYVDFSFYPRPNSFWARSVPEILESHQEELVQLHNMRANAIARKIAPPLLKRHGLRWDPDKEPWQPGQTIDVNDPSELVELAMADLPQGMFAHEQDIIAFVERVTGLSDYFLGRSPSQARTATEVNRVTSEGLARVDVIVSRLQHRGMKRLAWVLWWLLYQYRPYVDSFQIGQGEVQITKREMIPQSEDGLMPFEFIPQGQLSDSSREAKRQQLVNLLGIASGPLAQFFPDGIQKLLDKIFQEFDIQDRSLILGDQPWGIIQQMIQQAQQQGVQQGQQQILQQLQQQRQIESLASDTKAS